MEVTEKQDWYKKSGDESFHCRPAVVYSHSRKAEVDQLISTFSRGRRTSANEARTYGARQSDTDWGWERSKTAKIAGACAHQQTMSFNSELFAIFNCQLRTILWGKFQWRFLFLKLIGSILMLQIWTKFGGTVLLLW